MFVHLYGHTGDLTELAAWCRSRNLLLIEDAAHALGGHLPDGRPVGRTGNFCVLSFNRAKIIECGGGALVVGDVRLADELERVSSVQSLPTEHDPDRVAALEASARNLEHALIGLCRLGLADDIGDFYARVGSAYAGLYGGPLSDGHDLASAWTTIRSVLCRRYARAQAYEHALSGGPWQLLNGWRMSGVCWRYSFLVDFPERLSAFVMAIRARGALVSNLYWPLCDLYRPSDYCPFAHDFGRRIVNCCVDDSVDLDWVVSTAAEIRAVGEQLAARPHCGSEAGQRCNSKGAQ